MEMKSLTINGKKYDRFTPGDATDPAKVFKVREMLVAPADSEGICIYSESVFDSNESTPILTFNGSTGDEATILRNVAEPVKNWDAANKQYVDNRISAVTAITNDKIDEICGASVNSVNGVKF